MFVNYSSSLNITHTPPLTHFPSLYKQCLESIGSKVVYSLYNFIGLLLLPLFISILYMGFQQQKNQQSTSHSHAFTFHCVSLEIVVVLGSFVYSMGIYTNNVTLVMLGMFVSCIFFPGQTLFHLLLCAEHYLAVVQPIIYMRLRDSSGVRIRNISSAAVWLLCFGWVGLTNAYLPDAPEMPLFCMLGVSVIVLLFCCLSVLYVLTRSGPGEGGGNSDRVDQSKQRAFHIICAVMGTLLLRFFGLLFFLSISSLRPNDYEYKCTLMDCGILLTTPSSLVLPLLFLKKEGKLPCCLR